jgi:hypothetical protein
MDKYNLNRQIKELTLENIGAYKSMLIEDLEQNQNIEFITDEFFLKGIGILNWLYNSKTVSFWDIIHQYKETDLKIFSFNEFDNYSECLSLLGLYEPNLYEFFAYKSFTQKEEALQNYPQSYHLTQENLTERLDQCFLKHLSKEYRNEQKIKMRVKQLSDDFSIGINYDPSRIEYQSILTYRFPEIHLVPNNYKASSLKLIDGLNELQLRAGETFILFYLNSRKETIDENGVPNIEYLDEEPVIYHDNSTLEFIITNSYEKIKRYNAFIEIVMKLQAHHLRLFEYWLGKYVIPGIKI